MQQWDDVGAVLRQHALDHSPEGYSEWLVTTIAGSGGRVASVPMPAINGEVPP